MSDLKMEAMATDSMVNGLVARLERDGLWGRVPT